MAFELNPHETTSVKLPNSAWVFITDILRQLPYGTLVDSSQQGLLVQINSQIIAANTIEQKPESE